MKSKDDYLQEQMMKILLIKGLCEKHMVRVPASAAQASMKQMAMSILKIIEEDQ